MVGGQLDTERKDHLKDLPTWDNRFVHDVVGRSFAYKQNHTLIGQRQHTTMLLVVVNCQIDQLCALTL